MFTEADGLPVHRLPSWRHHFTWLRYTENSWDIAILARKKEKGEIGCSKEEIGVIIPQGFQTRSHAAVTRVLVGRSDLPTHSCRRSVVDDNGNPIFRNNICLEDRRLTSLRYAVYICAYAWACTKCSISAMTSFIPSFLPSGLLGVRNQIEENNWMSGDIDN